jgi:hypothetical protein
VTPARRAGGRGAAADPAGEQLASESDRRTAGVRVGRPAGPESSWHRVAPDARTAGPRHGAGPRRDSVTSKTQGPTGTAHDTRKAILRLLHLELLAGPAGPRGPGVTVLSRRGQPETLSAHSASCRQCQCTQPRLAAPQVTGHRDHEPESSESFPDSGWPGLSESLPGR